MATDSMLVDFSYECSSVHGREPQILTSSIPIPYKGSVSELAILLMDSNKCPCYIESELVIALKLFIDNEMEKWKETIGDEILLTAMEQKGVDQEVSSWVDKYTQNHAHFSTLKEVPDDPFPFIYLQLVHSPALTTLLQLEHTYSLSMNEICSGADNAMKVMQKKHDQEISNIMDMLTSQQKTDSDVNKLMRQQVLERKELEEKWTQEINNQQRSQCREYRDWLSRVHEEMNTDDKQTKKQKGGKKKSALSELQNQQPTLLLDDMGPSGTGLPMEESFTIHLGAQQKTSHNLRLICVDSLSFCSEGEGSANGGSSSGSSGEMNKGSMRLNPRRIETAMSLYTKDLTALVLTTDREINTISGMKEVFANICRQSTDFHFPSIDDQLHNIQQYGTQIKEMREIAKIEEQERGGGGGGGGGGSPYRSPNKSRNSSPERDSGKHDSSHFLLPPGHSSRGASPKRVSTPTQEEEEGVTLEPGDFYITRHSNLSQVHVVCHLVADDKAIIDSSLSTRHPIMQGLRNFLRTIAKNGLHRIILPLLLTNQMRPEMTITWCLRRAELVFKSVKGFLLESTTWQNGEQTWNVQFLLPQGISEDLFEQISDLLSKTYRTSISRNLSTRVL